MKSEGERTLEKKWKRREEDQGQTMHCIRHLYSTTSRSQSDSSQSYGGQCHTSFHCFFVDFIQSLPWVSLALAGGTTSSHMWATQKYQGVIIHRSTFNHWQTKVNGWMLLPFVSGGQFWKAFPTVPQKFPMELITVAHSGGLFAHSFPPSLFHSLSLINDLCSLGSLPRRNYTQVGFCVLLFWGKPGRGITFKKFGILFSS